MGRRWAEFAADIESLVRQQDVPFAGTSIYAQARVHRSAAAAGFKVVLDGQGADELFGGYPVFKAARFADLVRSGRFAAAARNAASGIPTACGLSPRCRSSRSASRVIVPEWQLSKTIQTDAPRCLS